MCDVANPNVLANIKFYMDKVREILEEALAYCWKTIETSKFLENRSLKKFLATSNSTPITTNPNRNKRNNPRH